VDQVQARLVNLVPSRLMGTFVVTRRKKTMRNCPIWHFSFWQICLAFEKSFKMLQRSRFYVFTVQSCQTLNDRKLIENETKTNFFFSNFLDNYLIEYILVFLWVGPIFKKTPVEWDFSLAGLLWLSGTHNIFVPHWSAQNKLKNYIFFHFIGRLELLKIKFKMFISCCSISCSLKKCWISSDKIDCYKMKPQFSFSILDSTKSRVGR
jgi:hypothetical protein